MHNNKVKSAAKANSLGNRKGRLCFSVHGPRGARALTEPDALEVLCLGWTLAPSAPSAPSAVLCLGCTTLQVFTSKSSNKTRGGCHEAVLGCCGTLSLGLSEGSFCTCE